MPGDDLQYPGESMTEISATMIRTERPVLDRAQAVDQELWRIAEEFEAVFLGEMLKHTGLGQMPEHFNGGVGERGFSGMLVQEYAAEIARGGSIGLAEHIYRTLLDRAGEAPQP